ncbi:MAG: glycosyltransferase family 4 protein, partial [Planctomycetales bacterium]|nr:glycosyltransferase family 4 protein [Planctomycetales bacterium]
MADYLQIDASGVHVIPHGLNLEGHAQRPESADPSTVVIGFLARVCHDKGLHLLAEAFIQLAQDPSLPRIELKAAGYLSSADRPYLREIETRLAQAGLADRFAYLGEIDRAEKIAVLQSFDVMALPTVYRESKGLPVLEAWANGVPVVVPRHGAFPEMIADTGGGLLCEPEDVASLANALAQLIRAPEKRAELGRQGRAAVLDRYHAEAMAANTRALYQRLIAGEA